MKNYSKILLAVLFSLSSIASIAQTDDVRSKLYSSLPKSINIDKSIFGNVLDAKEGREVSLRLSDEFTFNGTVISNFTKYNTLHTVMVRSKENATSILQVTLIVNNNDISYSGRIINANAADGYEIKNNNGSYSLQKFETLKILDPCKL